tara:strand:+ start:1221 stop:1634 length:414 start_codon:yes stop_codon:yes gene_type:complete
MPRKKRKRTRRKTFSILNGLEALTYASILSEGITGGSLAALLWGDTNLKSTVTTGGVGRGDMVISGQGQISLGDIMSEPSLALNQMGENFQANLMPMALAAFTTSVGFSVGRKLLRKPLSSVTRNIIHPVLGKGVRM